MPRITLDRVLANKSMLKPGGRPAKLNVGHKSPDGFDVLYQEIGDRVRHARQNRRYTQEALAKAAGIGRTTMVNMEQHGQRISLHILYVLAYLLDVSIYDLLPPELVRNEDDPNESTTTFTLKPNVHELLEWES
jgi:transcriptional regulator with XRE-family HTH domain